MTTQQQAIIQECKIQASSCQYTSTALYQWLGSALFWNKFWNAIPIILGAVASYGVISEGFPLLASFLALLAGLLPSVYEKLEIKAHTDEILSQAGQYKNLEHRLNQAASITALDQNSEALKAEFESLMRLLEDLRARPLVIPEKHFQAGRKKVKDGRYDPDNEILQNGI